MRNLILAVVTLPIQQSIAYLSLLVLPVAAPVVNAELGLDPAFVGIYTGVIFAVSTVTQMGCGGVIQRFGALRSIQVAMLMLGVGLILSIFGHAWVFLLCAVIMGFFYSASTPGSSQILFQYSPPKLAPITFSIKQTGVPLGGVIAGILIPFLVAAYGWEGAFVGVGLICILVAILLQPLRREFDKDRRPDIKITPKDIGLKFRSTVQLVVTHPQLRVLAFAGFSFAGLQLAFTTYFIIYMVEDLGHSLVEAGSIFAISQVCAVVARIFWGVVGSRWLQPRWVLAGLGVMMGITSVFLGLMNDSWTMQSILIIAILISITAIGWNGILLAEVARLAPDGDVAGTTGGVIGFASFGSMIFPVAYGIILSLTNSFSIGFFIAAIPATIAGIMMLRAPKIAPQ